MRSNSRRHVVETLGDPEQAHRLDAFGSGSPGKSGRPTDSALSTDCGVCRRRKRVVHLLRSVRPPEWSRSDLLMLYSPSPPTAGHYRMSTYVVVARAP